MYLHCSISIFTRVIRPMSSSAAADSTPQCIFIALFQFLLGLFARRASPPRRTPPRNGSSLLYFNFYSGYSPDELLRRGGLHPAMYLHCFISIFTRAIPPTSSSAAADSTPQCFFIALFQFYVIYSTYHAVHNNRTANIDCFSYLTKLIEQ
jgi:hypothetical protein